ncbi:MAG: HPr family phosphocarrier protein [Calditrichaceae bacterium]|nr:HPr family phosphocarrier protein [Calditrichaceae bacterium]MBN2707445.1 HPr family phosphocarrier protein [Calditrichaceae bacterium]RQV94013.1 MAG: HPr family phosphocarrier protein [Calditrichota bacterium]
MIEQNLKIINEHGLHARPAAQLVNVAGKFTSDIKILKDGLEVNGKSIMGVMMLAAEKGSEITLIIEGDDEQEAFNAINELINNSFYEK